MLINIIDKVVANDSTHALWLNTLSFMENAGARKISAAEHRTATDIIILKHAAEEARHAYYLKKQIAKVAPGSCATYEPEYILAPAQSMNYLQGLDIGMSRYLKKELGLTGHELRFGAYLLVTYAIEVRADELYPVYQAVLEKYKSKINVKFIILEEEGHLEEMIAQLERTWEDWKKHTDFACRFEQKLFDKWMNAVDSALS